MTNQDPQTIDSPEKKKLTQTERSQISKQRLIQACMESLIEFGYAQTSTQIICDKAGLSKGGLFRQFPSRTDLMIATAESIYDLLISQFETRFEHVDQQDSLSRNVASVVQKIFKTDTFQGALELTIASRTDETLRAGLVPMIQANIERVLGIARGLFPEAASQNPKFDALIHLLIMAFQGEVIDDLTYNSSELAGARFNLLVEIVERELENNP